MFCVTAGLPGPGPGYLLTVGCNERSDESRRGPGRPRNLEHDDAIIRAVREVLEEAGYLGLTIDSVASRAGVGRPTVYRRWPSKAALVIGALEERPLFEEPPPDTGDLREDLLAVRRRQLRLLRSSEGRHVLPGLVADVAEQSELHPRFSERYVKPWRELICQVVARAVDRGELAPHVDSRLVADVLTGPLVFRVIFAQEDPPEEALGAAIDLVLAGLLPRPEVG